MSLVADPGLITEGEDSGGRSRRRGYAWFVAVKVLGSSGSLLFMLVVNFFLFRVLPGDPVRTLGRGHLNTPAQIAAFKKAYGLDQPLHIQFLKFLEQTAHGDMG